MTLTTRNLLTIAGAALAFCLTLAVLALVRDAPSGRAGASGGRATVLTPAQVTDARIRLLAREVTTGAAQASTWAMLGDAYVQKAREAEDNAFYTRAREAYLEAKARDSRSVAAETGLGTVALGLHQYERGLAHGRAARRLNPAALAPYAVLVDALIELGRYRAAERALQEMVDRKPNLSSYARVSYFRELHGDLRGALEAMRRAVSAGGDAAENVAYVQALLGDLRFEQGKLEAARSAYRAALARYPAYAAAHEGLARIDAAEGRLGEAVAGYRALAERLPVPDHLIGLGEAELAAGRTRAGRRHVQAGLELLGTPDGSGADTDTERSLSEADHGSARVAVRLARRGYAAAPSVRSADALAWALTRAGRPAEALIYARRALRTGWRSPLALYHAGIAAERAGKPALARRRLSRALARNARFAPLAAPHARRVLDRLTRSAGRRR